MTMPSCFEARRFGKAVERRDAGRAFDHTSDTADRELTLVRISRSCLSLPMIFEGGVCSLAQFIRIKLAEHVLAETICLFHQA
jgi:hypothetical protein